jgi:general secretion pathway protein K
MNRRGSILVAVLAIAALLAVFVGVAAERLHVATAATRNAGEDIAADVAVKGVVELLFARFGGRFDDLPPTTSVDLPGMRVDIRANNEAGRIDLNLAGADLLAGIFRVVGADDRSARTYAQVIVDRRTDPAAPASRSRPPLVPPRGPFEHVREFEMLAPIPRDVVRAVLPFVTVTGLGARVSPLVAPREVVAALPGMDPSRVEAFMAERFAAARDFEKLVRRYGIVADHVSKEASVATRLGLVLRIGSHRIRGYEVVVAVLPGDDEPYRFLAWNGNALPPGVREPNW